MPHPLTRNVTALHHNYMSQCGNFSPSLVGHTDDRWRAGSRAYQLRIRLKDSHRRAGVVRKFVRKSPFCSYHRHILRDRRRGKTACPACWSMGIKWNEIVYGERKKCTWPTRAGQKFHVPVRRSQRTNQGMTPFTLSFVLILESPFASVSTVSRGHPTPLWIRVTDSHRCAGVVRRFLRKSSFCSSSIADGKESVHPYRR
jgi:hypothetical protein